MRKLLLAGLVATLAPVAAARVWTSVYRCDEQSPLATADANSPNVYRDIMVGTRLVLAISSDTVGPWWGASLIPWDDAPYGALRGRGYDEDWTNYDGSCLPAAGGDPFAQSLQDPLGVGFQFTLNETAVPGGWFILDYHAEQAGAVAVELYDGEVGFDVPVEVLSFRHVPSRDFDGDTVVNFEDFALLASRWRCAADLDPNSLDAAVDLDADGHLEIADLALFREYWLERTDCNAPGRP